MIDGEFWCTKLNPFNRMQFLTLIKWTSLFLFKGVLGGTFNFIHIIIEYSVSKQWRP